MITHHLDRIAGILTVTPSGPLEASDFEALAREIDPYLEQNGKLHGLMLYTELFPGWHDFAALVSHLKFVRAHHARIEKVAAVTDSGFAAIAPKVASHFVKAEIRHFPYSEKAAALAWLSGKA
jgi:hypothetical protein